MALRKDIVHTSTHDTVTLSRSVRHARDEDGSGCRQCLPGAHPVMNSAPASKAQLLGFLQQDVQEQTNIHV